MKYISTRDTSRCPEKVFAAEAIKKGLAPDRGLYMPEEIPALTEKDIEKLRTLPYEERAAEILSLFLTDYDKETMK